MRSDHIIEDLKDSEHAVHPWIALVQHGMLVGLYPAHQAEAADRAATRLALAGGRHVDVYEIGQHLPPPPKVGAVIDPEHLGWLNVG